MPTFDYKCSNCNHEYTYFHLNSNDKNKCPKCASQEAEKLPSKGTGIIYNTNGFHSTDYNKRGRKR